MSEKEQRDSVLQTMRQKVQEARIVLIGIGKEWRKQQPDVRKKAYEQLAKLVENKNYFILTMNTDDEIYDAGFQADRITAPFGSDHRYQCSVPCCEELWQEADRPADGRCPHCGAPLIANVRGADQAAVYVEQGYLPSWQAYTQWLTHTLNQKVVILELGVDFTMPALVRWPFERIGVLNLKAQFFRINQQWYQLSEELAETGRAYSLAEDSCKVLTEGVLDDCNH